MKYPVPAQSVSILVSDTPEKKEEEKLTSRENSAPPLDVSLKGLFYTDTAGTRVGGGLRIHVLNCQLDGLDRNIS